jgi:bifunctional non-homologous end joining protein LigD
MKCRLEHEFVVAGFTLPKGGGGGIGALLLGYYQGRKFCYAGRVGTGFSDKLQIAIRDRLETMVTKESRRNVSWVEPTIVVQVGFTAWTRDNLIRQSSFLGIREDKFPQEVNREKGNTEDDCRDCPTTSAVHAAPPHPNRKSARQTLNGVRITHPAKVIDPDSGATKQQVAEYYSAVADHLLPHIVDRPLSIVRCPDRIGKPCFFQKHLTQGLPAGVSNVNIQKSKTGELEEFLVVQNVEGLLGLAQLGVLEIHPWGSTASSVEKAALSGHIPRVHVPAFLLRSPWTGKNSTHQFTQCYMSLTLIAGVPDYAAILGGQCSSPSKNWLPM